MDLSDAARMTGTVVRQFNHFHFACGSGGGAKGLNRGSARIGNTTAKFRCIGGVDIDRGAIADFNRFSGARGTVMDLFSREQYVAFHGSEPPADWREVGGEDIRRAAGYEHPHIVCISSPCLPADGLVLTEDGERAISRLRVGQRVLTHRGRWREITHIGHHPYAGTMHGLRLNGTVDTQWFTDEHPIWVRRIVRNGSTDQKRVLGPAQFMAAQHVRVGDRVGFPIEPERAGCAAAFVGSFGNPQEVIRRSTPAADGSQSVHVMVTRRVVDLSPLATNPNLWFLLGCYLGDGYRRQDGHFTVSFCVGAADGPLAHRIRAAATVLGIPCSEDRTAGASNVKLSISSKHLYLMCGALGDGAGAKRIPQALMGLEAELLEYLIDGYRSTDGSESGRRPQPSGIGSLQARWKIPSISLQLLRDVQRLLLRLGTFASIHKVWSGGEQVIMGRKVQTRPRWELSVRLDPIKRSCYEFIDGAVWVRVRSIDRREAHETVWNLSVDEDDTFCVPMMATHNCKGLSGLLSESKSKTAKYQALNALTLRCVWLMCEAWRDDPVEMILFENVPRIQTRGRPLLDQIVALLRHYGYAVAETTHDCGELGGLAQTRKRFLLVARHEAKVPPFLYEPEKKRVQGVGEVLGRMPLPGDARGGAMHRVPSLAWKTWVRLAMVRAGSDWRSLNDLAIEGGVLRDWMIVPERQGAARSADTPVADPRFAASQHWNHGQQYGVHRWDEPSGTVGGQQFPAQGRFSVADPRSALAASAPRNLYRVVPSERASATAASMADPRATGVRHNNVFRVVGWDHVSPAVTAGTGPSAGGVAVADPRSPNGGAFGKYAVTQWDEPSNTVIGGSTTGQGAFAVADPRAIGRDKGDAYLTGGHYGVVGWDESTGAVSGSACHDNGAWSVADPRVPTDPDERLVAVIRSADGTWHRPFTTLELAALQSLIDPEEFQHQQQMLPFDGESDSAWRERIGNAIPPAAAEAIGNVMAQTLLLAELGEREVFSLRPERVWVQPLQIAIAMAQGIGHA